MQIDNRPIIYIPLYNAEDWCRELVLDQGFKYVASNNCSTDDSANILIKKGVEVINQHNNLGRIGNWQFCIDHFRASEGEWMSFLFTGDKYFTNAGQLFQNVVKDALIKNCNVIIFQYLILEGVNATSTKTLTNDCVIKPVDALTLSIDNGNWFGGVLGNFFNKSSIVHINGFTNFEWASDYQFFVDIASKNNLYYSVENIGEFNSASRNFYKLFKVSLSSLFEENLVKLKALKMLSNLGMNERELLKLEYRLVLKAKIMEYYFSFKSARNFKELTLVFLRLSPIILLEYFIYRIFHGKKYSI